MTYQIPDSQFDAVASARVRATTANNFRVHLVEQYKANFERFWQCPLTHGERALDMAEMQATLDVLGVTAIDILTDSAGFAQYIATAYPEALAGEEPLLPPRFLSSPYEYTADANGITLTSLKTDWEEPVEDPA